MSRRIVVDTESCTYGWGPCLDSYGFSHTCKKPREHRGRHVCLICGKSTRALASADRDGE